MLLQYNYSLHLRQDSVFQFSNDQIILEQEQKFLDFGARSEAKSFRCLELEPEFEPEI